MEIILCNGYLARGYREMLELDVHQKRIQNAICGNCLHSRDAHEKHNGHFMKCASCQKLCDIDEFLKVHLPTSLEITYEIQSKREYSQYKPKEIKENAD